MKTGYLEKVSMNARIIQVIPKKLDLSSYSRMKGFLHEINLQLDENSIIIISELDL
ncbi:hypothetical protein G9F72_013020 [Clostridium estertheticum]|uniref:hypothetical protein n=1 Tax=Clostridium estertheticum TaxID=238834 RepID=UPI001CD17162|nr:hypothetical protein [Clostridium estertheticum]MBZ9687248.1 hypothetical protein [Clostridium estertheticum]